MSLWDFSLNIYGRPAVPAVCLSMQEDHGADVNLLLFCAWMGAAKGRRLDSADCTRLMAETAGWRDGFVRPLRALRRAVGAQRDRLPAGAEPYEALKAAELALEHAQQLLLERDCSSLGQVAYQADHKELAADNMMTYMAVLESGDAAGLRERLSVIAQAAAAAMRADEQSIERK